MQAQAAAAVLDQFRHARAHKGVMEGLHHVSAAEVVPVLAVPLA